MFIPSRPINSKYWTIFIEGSFVSHGGQSQWSINQYYSMFNQLLSTKSKHFLFLSVLKPPPSKCQFYKNNLIFTSLWGLPHPIFLTYIHAILVLPLEILLLECLVTPHVTMLWAWLCHKMALYPNFHYTKSSCSTENFYIMTFASNGPISSLDPCWMKK